MRIAFFLEPSAPDRAAPRLGGVAAEIIERLRARSAHVDLIVPEAGRRAVDAIRPEHDLYVLKSKTPLALSLAGILERCGARVVNCARASSLARDKITATALLAACGVPVPPSWATGRTARLRPLLEQGAIWLKSPRGSQGRGVRRLAATGELDAVGDPLDPQGLPLALLVQREVPSGGRDLKVYVVGERVWAIERVYPARSLEQKRGTPAHLVDEVREAALACGRALGLEVYGVDFLVAGEGFFAVDVNPFPGFKGVAEAPGQIADHLWAQGLGRAQAAANREENR